MSEAQKRALKRYYEKTKDAHRSVLLRFHREKDADVLAKLDSVPSKVGYIRELVRNDRDS